MNCTRLNFKVIVVALLMFVLLLTSCQAKHSLTVTGCTPGELVSILQDAPSNDSFASEIKKLTGHSVLASYVDRTCPPEMTLTVKLPEFLEEDPHFFVRCGGIITEIYYLVSDQEMLCVP